MNGPRGRWLGWAIGIAAVGCGPPDGARLQIEIVTDTVPSGTTDIRVEATGTQDGGPTHTREVLFDAEEDPFVFQVLVPAAPGRASLTVSAISRGADPPVLRTLTVEGVPLADGPVVVIGVEFLDP